MRAEQQSQLRALAEADQRIAELEDEREELLRELALAEAYIESQQRHLVAAGVLDPGVLDPEVKS